jgi:hypothetical protein
MELEQSLEQLIVDLDFAARQARDRVRDVNLRPVANAADEAEHQTWLRALLSEMSCVIDRTSRGNGAAKERRLDLWPGYDSVLLDGRRITFEVGPTVRELLSDFGYANGEDRTIQTGLSFPALGNRTDRATLYFDAALAGTSGRSAEQSTFSVGSTHNWLALGPNAGTDPLIGFQVRTEKAAVASQRAFPSIDLDPARPLEWGDALAAAIADLCGDEPHSFWPLPVRRKGESRSEYAARLELEHRSPEHRQIRQDLYSLWLIGCFVSDPASILLEGKGRGWLTKLTGKLKSCDPERASRLEQLRSLERNMAGSESSLTRVHFTTWGVVTIPYPIACTKNGDDGQEIDDLGSGMLLSNFDVPHWYYFVIRQWIASYYLSLRQHENSVLMAEREAHRAAIYAERQLRRQLSHAVGTELTYIEFLASVAGEDIAEKHFTPRAPVLLSGVEGMRRKFDLNFIEQHGRPTPLETALIGVIRETHGPDQLLRDVGLIEKALAAVPSEKGRKVIGALAGEVARVARENRALVRVDDVTVVAKLERSRARVNDENAVPLIELLNRALIVSLTVYFRKAFPPSQEGSEGVCIVSAEALFGDAGDSEEERRSKGYACAVAWREFVADAYRTKGQAPAYDVVQAWICDALKTWSRLQLELPSPDDATRLKPGCGEHAPLVIEAWLMEALLNALKHSRPIGDQSRSVIRVDWLHDDAILEISNTTTPESAAEVRLAVDAAWRGGSTVKRGHQGLAFLGYAAKHLFEGATLHSEFIPDKDKMRLFVA